MFAKIYMKYLDLKTRGKIKRKHRKETGNQSLDDKSPQLFQILKAIYIFWKTWICMTQR